MTYVVLARKYRPRTFSQMVGQDAVVQALSSALATGRLHHAYLFTGTRGIGKTTISRILAKSLNCIGPDGRGGITAEPCGVCAVCREIDADRFVDYVELDAASNRSIDEIRDLLERAAYKPSVGRFKVFMIDEAHQLTKDSFNALLKTLEEPPDYLKFVLATTDPQKMLPTVLSRCLQFNLRSMSPEVVELHLAHVLQSEGLDFEPEALPVLGQAARGSMRDALSLTDQALAYGQGHLTAQGVRAMIGMPDTEQACELVYGLAAHDAVRIQAALEGLRDQGESAPGVVESVLEQLQCIALEQALPGSLDGAQAQRWSALAGSWDRQEVHLCYQMLLSGRGELSLVDDEFAALQMVAWRYLAFSTQTVVEVPASRLPSRSGRALRGHPVLHREAKVLVAVPTVPPANVAVVVEPPVSAQPEVQAFAPRVVAVEAAADAAVKHAVEMTVDETVDAAEGPMQVWTTWVGRLLERQALGGLQRELALQAQCVSVADGLVRLRVPRESLASAGLGDKLAETLGRTEVAQVRLQIETGPVTDSLAVREARVKRERQERALSLWDSDPLVQQLTEAFPGARALPDSIQPQP